MGSSASLVEHEFMVNGINCNGCKGGLTKGLTDAGLEVVSMETKADSGKVRGTVTSSNSLNAPCTIHGFLCVHVLCAAPQQGRHQVRA